MKEIPSNSKTVSVIIPTYNEGSRIVDVINSVSNCVYVKEIIVVDDGSSDDTVDVVSQLSNVVYLRHSTNQGKSAAIKTGLNKVTASYVFLLDGDIPNITEKNLKEIIKPVILNKYDVTIALIGDLPQRIIKFDFLSGLRVMKTDVLRDFFTKHSPRGYEIETLLNMYMLNNKFRVAYVDWTNSHFVYSTKKYKFITGFKHILAKRIRAYKTVGLLRYYLMFYLMLSKRKWLG